MRVELGEVEAALSGGAGVEQAVARAVLDPNSGSKRLVGYVTPASVDTEALLAHCRTLLIPAMVPSLIVAMGSFPLLPNGKVNTKGLPTPEFGVVNIEYVAPASAMELTIQEIWMDVLGITDPISVNADFFEIGGPRRGCGVWCMCFLLSRAAVPRGHAAEHGLPPLLVLTGLPAPTPTPTPTPTLTPRPRTNPPTGRTCRRLLPQGRRHQLAHPEGPRAR